MPRSASELTQVEQLQSLRKRCAATENRETLKRIAGDVEELRWIAADPLLGAIADLTDRIDAKIAAVTAAPHAASEKRQVVGDPPPP